MILVVGLGNPGKKYDGTRHNVGFAAVDAFVRSHGVGDFRDKFSGEFGKADVAGTAVSWLKPQTFMNLSGESVQPAMAFLKTGVPELVVVHDELDLPFGDVRLKVGGGHAGHNGLRSILGRVGSPDFVRVRVGIGRPPADFRGDVAAFVLQGFDSSERAALPGVFAKVEDALVRIVRDGVRAATNALHAGPAPSRSVSGAAPAGPRKTPGKEG